MAKPYDRVPLIIRGSDGGSGPRETYGFASADGVTLEGQLLRNENESNTVLIFMHPSSTLNLMPIPSALAEEGFHVLCASSRYPKNDSALIMEKVVLDLGSWVRWAREEGGYSQVILVGWSGGGSLSLLYQAEAEDPSITATPAGDPVDLTSANLISADGIIYMAAHLSRAETLTQWLDPSVVDETKPYERDARLDIYADNPVVSPPYSDEFIEEFRAAQVARNQKITAWVKERLQYLKSRGLDQLEEPFVVHRTMCDVRWLDPSIDPNDRKPVTTYMGDPRVVNAGPVGLARFTTLRSWLSQWSLEETHTRSTDNAKRIRKTPVLQIENSADDAVPATHNPLVRDALATQDSEYHVIEGATHYYKGQPEHLREVVDLITRWCIERDLLKST